MAWRNAVKRLQQEMGYSASEAQVLYNQLSGAETNTFMQLYNDVEGNKAQEEKLTALYGAAGEEDTYANMLQTNSASRVDSYLQNLSRTEGEDVLPDRVGASFSVDGEKVELTGKQYLSYAERRTRTAYNILNELVPQAGSYSQKEQAEFVGYVEDYATQTAKANVSDFEPYKWMQAVQEQAGGDSEEQYRLIMAKALISLAEGQKDENGRTISGTKKAAAISRLQDAGYSTAMAQQMYKLFG